MARITHLAKELGISAATVSRALSRPDMVSLKTREKILNKAKELGIDIGNSRALIEGQEILGVIVADLNNSFSAGILNAITECAYNEDYRIMLGVTQENPTIEKKIIADFNCFKLKGLISMPSGISGPLGIECSNIVAVDRPYTNKQTKCALIDNKRAVKIAYDHLMSKGHEKIVFINGKSSLYTFKTRLSAAKEYSNIETFELDALEYNNLYTSAFELTNILLGRGSSRPTAILTANNAITAGVVYALSLRNIQMPNDLALVSIGDTEWCRFYPTPITSIKLPEDELGRTAFDLLKIHENTVRLIEPILMVRAST